LTVLQQNLVYYPPHHDDPDQAVVAAVRRQAQRVAGAHRPQRRRVQACGRTGRGFHGFRVFERKKILEP
jgi:hypothetical protein